MMCKLSNVFRHILKMFSRFNIKFTIKTNHHSGHSGLWSLDIVNWFVLGGGGDQRTVYWRERIFIQLSDAKNWPWSPYFPSKRTLYRLAEHQLNDREVWVETITMTLLGIGLVMVIYYISFAWQNRLELQIRMGSVVDTLYSVLCSIAWFIILLLIALPVGFIAAKFYIIVSPFNACCDCTKTITDFLMKGINFPYVAACNVKQGSSQCC